MARIFLWRQSFVNPSVFSFIYEDIVDYLVRFRAPEAYSIVKTIALTLPKFYRMRYNEITAPEKINCLI